MNNKKLFLLGGYDLEMLEIKAILERLHVSYQDKNLSWGAKLSEHTEFLNFDGEIYGIELEEDIIPPSNYHVIDHHGKNSDKPSSLEQVAKLLHVELSRKQELIAANDKEYISGMKKLCATKEEIESIRKADRVAQGVIEADEELAKHSVEASSSNIIFAHTPHFSAISDLVYEKYSNYIIYNEEKIVFYGYKYLHVKEFFTSQSITQESFYYGGGDFEFVGIKQNILSKKEIENLIEEFKKVEDKETIYSYHTFMLPFTFTNDKSFTNQTKQWKHKNFKIHEQRDYNEFCYFYKHVQDALFNIETKENEKWISKYYEYEKKCGTYSISCKKGNFDLEIDGISLRIFNTNVAILALNLKNIKHSNADDILAINDFGRRIYPQFLGKKFTIDTKNAVLADCLTLHLKDETPIVENFTRFDEIKNLQSDLETQKELKLLPNFVEYLIGKDFSNNIRPIIDDRMFVISQYNNDAIVGKLKAYNDYKQRYEYENNDWWYQYIFVDGDSKTCQSKHMTQRFIADSTYDRWVDWGTLFGISRYSFVSITGSDFGKNVLLAHTQTMYFQMFTLLLAYRATIIKFADDIQDATKKDDNQLSIETKKVYKKYLNFLNKLYFKEISAQDQGIELYNQAMKIMDIEKYINDLDNEINELYSYTNMIEEEQRNYRLEKISILGGILLPPSLLAAYYGVNTIDFTKDILSLKITLGTLILSIVGGYLSMKSSFKYLRITGIIMLILLFFYAFFFSPLNLGKNDNNATSAISHIKIKK